MTPVRFRLDQHDAVRPASVDKLDTGELIRVEETLAIAAETAKKVVSLRRKRRSQRREGLTVLSARRIYVPDQ
jgi:hypothetical protein